MNRRRNWLATFSRPPASLPLSEPVHVVLSFVALEEDADAYMCELVQDLNHLYSTDQWVGDNLRYFGDYMP